MNSTASLQQAHALLATGQVAAAQALFETWLSQEPADAYNGLGLCAEATQQLSAAEGFYRQALALAPQEPEYLNNLAICLQTQGQRHAALQVFRQLAEIRPEPELLYNLALALAAAGQFWDAIGFIRQLLAQQPRVEAPLILLIELVERLGQNEQNLTRLQQLQAADPAEPVYQLALAVWYDGRGHSELAVRYFRAALRANPLLLGVYRQLMYLLQSRGHYSEALNMARQVFTQEISPQSLGELMTSLQHPIPVSETQIQLARQEATTLLENWQRQHHSVGRPGDGLPRPVSIPFYFCYQTGSDRDFQQLLARFYACSLQALPMRRPGQLAEAVSATPVKPRLGIFTTRLHRHSVTDLLSGALETLLQSETFESHLCFCLHQDLGSKPDAVTLQLQALADQSLSLSQDVLQAAGQIAALDLDLLIYTDVGMDPYTYALALKRLARYQLVLPGHPVTTGMANMDYFVSGQDLEPPQGQDFYSETLVRLPGLPDYLRPVEPLPVSRQELGLPEGHLYFCPMTLFKIQPAFDAVMARILTLDPHARVLLLEYKNQLHLQLQKRFAERFPDLAERLVFLAWSNQERFFQRLQAVDVMLDTFPFGGGNTSYQALGLGCPIVCLDVPWQKGRWTQAMYKLMGIEGLVAADPEAYAQLAVKVACDKAWQATLRHEIKQRSAVLFDNPTWSQALHHFCVQLLQPPPSAGLT